MSDRDDLPARGIPAYSVVDENGVSTDGTSASMNTIRSRGMQPICEVNASGVATSGSTMNELRSRGIRFYCAVTENAVTSDAVSLGTLRSRGVLFFCPVDVNGIAVGGTATLKQLEGRGIPYACLLDSAGSVVATPSGTLIAGGGSYLWTGQDASLVIEAPLSVAAGSGSYAWTGDTMNPFQDHFVTASGGSYAWTGQNATLTKSGSYAGPGDVVSGAFAWYGLRAYNAAYATGSNPALDLLDQAGANAITINILSTGRLDVASISAWVTANSVTTIKITRIYDQTGNARHVNQATLSQMPSLNLTGFGSLPAMVFATASTQFLESSATVTQSQPITFSSVQLRGSSSGVVAQLGANNIWVRTFTDGFSIFAGTQVSTTGSIALNGSWHAIQSVINTTSSAVFSDGGSNTALSPGSNNASALTIGIGKNVTFPIGTFEGSMAEVGIWPSAFDSTQAGDMNTNQHHATNGYNF